jgi:hypothetical protein
MMYRILLSNDEFEGLRVGEAEHALGFVMGRAVKMDGMMSEEYAKPTVGIDMGGNGSSVTIPSTVAPAVTISTSAATISTSTTNPPVSPPLGMSGSSGPLG